MKNDTTLKMTELDYLTAAPHLQMIKAALPYIHIPEQRFFSLMVKVSELERTIRLFDQGREGEVGICSLDEGEADSPIDMLNAMKPYGTQEEQDFIDLILNFIQGSLLYQSYRESAGEEEELRESAGEEEEFREDAGEEEGVRESAGEEEALREDAGEETGLRKAMPSAFSVRDHILSSAAGDSPGDMSAGDILQAASLRGAGRPGAFRPGNSQSGGGSTKTGQRENVQGKNLREGDARKAPVPGANRENRLNSLPLSLEQLKNMLPPEQQSRFETAQMLMQAFRQFSEN